MSDQEWKLVYFVTQHQRIPFREWFELLRDFKARVIIDARIARLRTGNFGSSQPVGQSVFELKIDYGPGYRVYFGKITGNVIILLCGGDKSTQKKDIQTAQWYWQWFKEKN